MKRDGCSMAPLLEAHRDGRLGGKDAASFARHLATCAECRDHARALDEVRDLLRAPAAPPLSPLEHQRRRLALLRAAAAPDSGREGAARRLPAYAARAGVAALAMAAVVAIGVSMRGASQQGSVAVAGRMPAAVFRASERAVTTVEASAGARFERRSEGGVDRVDLGEGTIDLAVKKLAPGERFLVVTSDAEVEVRGTIFQVAASSGRITHVAVTEGKVEVRYRRAISLVPAGGEWRPPVEIAAEIPAPGVASAAAQQRPIERPAAIDARPAPRGAAPKPSGASRDFADAMGLLERGDYAAAAERLDAFGAANPSDARAADAAFLAIVSLQRAGRRAEAADAARRYLARFPRGDRRAEAQAVANGAP